MAAEVRQLDLILKLKDDATKHLQGFSSKLESMQPAFQKMAVAGTAAFVAIGAGIGKTVKDAVALGESVNAVNVVFGEGAENILKFGEGAAKAVGMATSEFNQMATITGALLKDTGKPMQEVSDMTVELTKRAADMASVFNTDVNDAMSAINQAIRGETEAIRRYAGDVTDATLETFLLSKGIKTSVTDLTQQEKRLYRVQLIMQQTAVTANDFKNTSDSLANQQRILSSEFKNISATIGQTFIPIIQNLLTQVKPYIEKLAEWIKQNPELTKNIILGTAAVAALVVVLGTIGLVLPSVITGFGLLVSAGGTLLTSLIAISTFLLSPIGLIAVFTILAGTAIFKAIQAWNELKTTQDQIKASMQQVGANLDEMQKKVGSLSTEKANQQLQNTIDKARELQKEADRLANLGFFGSLFEGGKEMLKKAGKTIGVNDAIITPQGDVIKTDPSDYLIATKTPGALAGASSGGITVNVNYPMVLDRSAGEKLAQVLSETLRTKLRI